MKSFEYWLTQEVEDLFGLEEVEKHPLLETWLNALPTLDLIEEAVLDKLRPILASKVKYWNEDELKFQFIAPLIYFLDFGFQNFIPFLHNGTFQQLSKWCQGRLLKSKDEWNG